jgi:hypothetical protein
MRFSRTLLCATSAILLASASYAEDPTILPPVSMDHISAGSNSDSSDVMSTRHASEPATNAPAAPPIAPTGMQAAPVATYQGKMPFGHGETPAPIIPSGPHETVAVPVVNVQSLDAPEASPATPVTGQADPAKEDPAEPTELTSPIFGESDNPNTPRKIVLRVLNKVTAQSQLLLLKPNETVKIGHVEITAITCQTSAPQSQTDYAGLLDIVERSQTDNSVKPLFRGWMYASSPSITALEHPVYDVTMVDCQTPQAAVAKDDDKAVRKAKK